MTFDLFGYEKYRYTFIPRCEEVPECSLDDGAVRIFLSTKGKNAGEVSKELVDFLHYLEDTTDVVAESTESERIKRIHRRVRRVKSSEEIGVKYMQAWEERYYDKQEAQEEGRAEGIAMGRAEVVQALIETYVECGISRQDAKQKMMCKLKIDEPTALQYLEKYWEEAPQF